MTPKTKTECVTVRLAGVSSGDTAMVKQATRKLKVNDAEVGAARRTPSASSK